MENILFDKNNNTAEITINRPKSLNALNKKTLNELKNLLYKIKEDKDIKVLIITGAGQKAFVAGADIKEMQNLKPFEAKVYAQLGQEVFFLIESLPQPVIAAVNGYALGGGCELALACDIRYASENAMFGQPEVKLGITPGFAGTQRLPKLIGDALAKEMIFTGEMINAKEAYRIGLVNKIFGADELLEQSKNTAETIIKRSFTAVSLAKELIKNSKKVDVESGSELEANIFGLCFSGRDQKEGMNAFLEKRTADFS